MKRFPVKVYRDKENEIYSEYAQPDPFVFRWKNKYFCYVSGENGILAFSSENLTEFQEERYVYEEVEEHSFWAPSVFFWQGKFYLYYSSLKKEETDDHLHFLRVAVADHPLGPFKWMADLTDYFAIDSHVISKEGKFYIFYAANIHENKWNQRIGTVIWVDELLKLDKMSGQGKIVLYPTLDEEIFARNRFGDGKDWHTLEGPCYLSDGENSWLLYSGNAYTSPKYFIGYASGKTVDELKNVKLKKCPDENRYHPLVCAKNGVEGTGHNSITQAPDHITPILVYHGRQPGDQTGTDRDDRKIYTDYIWREGTAIRTDAPTCQNEKKFPQSDIHYLKETKSLYEVYEKNKCLVSGCYEVDLQKKESLYLELCVRIPKGELQIWDMKNKKKLMCLTGDYWQHAGLLLEKNQIRCRYGEEWTKPFVCQVPEKIELRISNQVYIEYFDGTFLQNTNDNTLSVLL